MRDQDFIKNWDEFIRRKECRNSILLKSSLNVQLRQFTNAAGSDLIRAEKAILKINHDPIIKSIRSVYHETGVQWANEVRLYLMTQKGYPMRFSQHIVDLINQYFTVDFLNISEIITKTTRDSISALLVEANIIGESINWIVKKANEKNIPRVRLIARTESVAASNKAGLISATESGLDLNKDWLAVDDKRTRPHHHEADGQSVPLDGFFIVGGYEMEHPGDKGGKDGRLKVPPEETCNCRCTTGYSRKRV